jgi:hypothetical protein
MKKIITILILFTLISCGQEHIGTPSDLTLVCDIKNEIRDMKSQIIESSNGSMEFNFVDKKLYPYQCSWSNKTISCWTDIKHKFKNEEILFNINREKGDISGFEKKVNKDGLETFINFEGSCKKLYKKF